MICRYCGGSGELIYFNHVDGIESAESCTHCHWNGIERVSNSQAPKLLAINFVLRSINEQMMKMEARKYDFYDSKRANIEVAREES